MSAEYSRSGKNSLSTEPMSVGDAVRRTRKLHRLSQSDLAGLAGTGLRFVSELERGKPNVALDKTQAVLAVLGLRLQVVESGP